MIEQNSNEKNDPTLLRQAIKKISNGRARLLLSQPFYGVLLSQIDFILDNNISTMATTGSKIYFNSKFVMDLTEDEVFGVLLHEIDHCIYMHCTTKRRMNRDHHLWNVATDFAVNLEIRDLGFVLPKDALIDDKYRKMNAEQIYDALQKEPQKDTDQMETLDTHISNDDESDWDDMEDRIISAYEATKDSDSHGNLPGGLKRWIDKMRKSRVKWERIFHRYVGQALSKDDFSYARCNKRFLGQEIYLPDLRNYIIGNVVIAIDTSGSISQNCLEQFAAEISKVSHLVSEVTAMTCDANVQEVVKIRKFDNWLKKLQMKGGGGTAFEPVFNKVKELKIVPELLIYLTDAWGSFPNVKPQYPVLWCVTSRSGMDYIPWGQKVLLPDEKGNDFDNY